MRCMPMAVWTKDLDDFEIQKAVHAECEFTHPNQYVKEVVFIYVIALSYLLKYNAEEDPLHIIHAFEFIKLVVDDKNLIQDNDI